MDTKRIFAVGLIDKYISSSAIEEAIRLNDEKTVVVLKEGGIFAFTAKKSPSKVVVNAHDVEYNCADGALYQIDCSQYKSKVIVEIYH